MILTVFVFIFVFRMRDPVIDYFDITKKQKEGINFLFLLINLLFLGLIVIFDFQSLQFLTPMICFLCELPVLKLIQERNLKFLLIDLENLLTKLSISLTSGFIKTAILR